MKTANMKTIMYVTSRNDKKKSAANSVNMPKFMKNGSKERRTPRYLYFINKRELVVFL